MLDKIVDGISEKLIEVFGKRYKVYTESVEQGLKNPCFFINLVNPASTNMLGERFFRENLFCIQYFPKSKEPKAECYKVQDKLYVTLDYIEIDGKPQRGIKMRGEFIDGVLHFFVNYNMFVVMTEEKVPMEVLQVPKIRTKG